MTVASALVYFVQLSKLFALGYLAVEFGWPGFVCGILCTLTAE